MLTALLVLILAALILIERDIVGLKKMLNDMWRCPECHGSGHASDAADPEERCGACYGSVIGEMNARLAQITGATDRIHNAILKLWACPTRSGSGQVFSFAPPETKQATRWCRVSG